MEQSQQFDPFLQRAVEYWLDSSNELGYQPLFCAWLSTIGYAVKHSSKGGALEQGKDVIATDGDGVVHAYQLKGGSISLARWRTEVRPEVEELIDLPVKHPEVDKTKGHVSYLVTNGELEDSVKVQIADLNENKWRATPLHVLTRGDLLTHFQAMAGGLLPRDAETYKQLIDLIFRDRTGLPDLESTASFLIKVLRPDDKLSKEQRRRDIAAAVLYANLIAGPYRGAANYISTIRVMVILTSQIMLCADRHRLDDRYWLEAYRTVWNDILATARLLESEVNDDGFNKTLVSPMDRELHSFRRHLAALYVFALKVAELITGDPAWRTVGDVPLAERYRQAFLIWGEASLIPFIFLTLLLRRLDGGAESAYYPIRAALNQIVTENGRGAKDGPGLLSPYYDVDFGVQVKFGLLDDPFEEDYRCSSYLVKPLIDILARNEQREIVTQQWRELSFISSDEFVPSEDWQHYLWRSPQGVNSTVVPPRQQSWAALVQDAKNADGRLLPAALRRFPQFVPFFLATFPHRIGRQIVGLLDKTSADASERQQ